MKMLNKSWTATSQRHEALGKDEELSPLVNGWDLGIEVYISNPCDYTNGPVQVIEIEKEALINR